MKLLIATDVKFKHRYVNDGSCFDNKRVYLFVIQVHNVGQGLKPIIDQCGFLFA